MLVTQSVGDLGEDALGLLERVREWVIVVRGLPQRRQHIAHRPNTPRRGEVTQCEAPLVVEPEARRAEHVPLECGALLPKPLVVAERLGHLPGERSARGGRQTQVVGATHKRHEYAPAIACDDAFCYNESTFSLEIVHIPRKVIVPNLDDLIRDWQSGVPLHALCRRARVGRKVLYSRLREAGIRIRPKPIINLSELIRVYSDGTSLKELSDETGIGRGVLLSRFRQSGVELRGRSAAERLKWSRTTIERRQRQTEAAHAAVLGMKRPLAELIDRARTRMVSLRHRGQFEDAIATRLRERRYRVVQQLAVERYNVDIAIPTVRIAVEVVTAKRGGWDIRSLRPDRLKYLLDRQWHVLIVFVANAERAADEIVAFAKEMRRTHPGRPQYRVVGRKMYAASASRFHLDHGAEIEHTRPKKD